MLFFFKITKQNSEMNVQFVGTMNKILCLCVLFSVVAIDISSVASPVSGLRDCEFPAIFNFGDSNSDTGGLAASLVEPPPPYGRTFFNMPSGRFSDGRLVIDFIAEHLGLRFLDAYLNALGTNFSNGANFATAASTITLPTSIIPNGGFSPFYLDVEFMQFMRLKSISHRIRQQGGVFASLMPKEEYFSEALYTFDIGQNDLGQGFFGNLTIQQVNASVPSIVNSFSSYVKRIYNATGGRTYWIHNTGPIGCLPYIFVNLPSTDKDVAGCSRLHNEVAQYFNSKLKEAIVELRKDLPSVSIIYVDVYTPKYSLFLHPKKYGFKDPLVACCGYGGEYNYNGNAGCGETLSVNGTSVLVGSCDRPSVRVVWDGIHYTDAASKFIFDQISTGAFSDPPVPLHLACTARQPHDLNTN